MKSKALFSWAYFNTNKNNIPNAVGTNKQGSSKSILGFAQ